MTKQPNNRRLNHWPAVLVAAIAHLFKFNKRRTHHYPDPVFGDVYHGHRSGGTRRNSRKKGRPRLGRPPCQPGTITYHDKLVRHFGRRRADEIGRRIQKGQMDNLPFVSKPSEE